MIYWKSVGEYIGTDEEDSQTIAYLSNHRNRRVWTDEEEVAHANLIAAAPGLLEALEALVEQFEKVQPLYSSDKSKIQQAKEVIAKAKGEK